MTRLEVVQHDQYILFVAQLPQRVQLARIVVLGGLFPVLLHGVDAHQPIVRQQRVGRTVVVQEQHRVVFRTMPRQVFPHERALADAAQTVQ